jgi:hypothetical protein
VALAIPILLAGCGAAAPPEPASGADAVVPAQAPEARAQLAALAAAAQDRHLAALYTLTVPGRPNRTVAVTSASDGSWRVDIPGGALGGTVDVSVAQTRAGLFQCALPSPVLPDSQCVRVADADGRLPATIDPRVQHAFSDWRDVLTDRQAPLFVAASKPLPGARGTCFAVESTSASLRPPVDVGTYCYDSDGTLTAARLGFGTLMLAGTPTAAPSAIALPGPVVDREPLGMALPSPQPSDAAEAVSPSPTPTQ